MMEQPQASSKNNILCCRYLYWNTKFCIVTVKLTGAVSAGAANDITVDGTDARLLFAPGDTITAMDDAAIGIVGTVPDDTSILLKDSATNTAALENDDDIYNVNPITLRLTFERL
jgi:hypothetical protein